MKTLPPGWIVCPQCDGAGEYVTVSHIAANEPVTCKRCKGEGAIRG